MNESGAISAPKFSNISALQGTVNYAYNYSKWRRAFSFFFKWDHFEFQKKLGRFKA